MSLVSVPERGQVRLIPDVDNQASCHAIRVQIREELGEVVIPAGPVSIITRVRGRRALRAVCAPQVVYEQDESPAIVSGCFVIIQDSGETGPGTPSVGETKLQQHKRLQNAPGCTARNLLI